MKNEKSIPIKKDILEIVKAEFINENYKIEFPYTVYRIDNKGMRLYASYIEDKLLYGPSITTIIDRMQPASTQLDKWKIENFKTHEDYKIEMEKRATYGTFLHIQFANLLKGESLPSLDARAELKYEFDKNDIYLRSRELKMWCDKYKKDILSFLCWVLDYEIEPISIEQSLLDYKNKNIYGGCIDLVCKATIPEKVKNEKNEDVIKYIEQLIIVDFKSGESGFFESHQLQLEACRQMWNNLYPDHKVDRIFNLGMNKGQQENFYKYYNALPCARFKPYKFTEHTKSKNLWKWDFYLEGFGKTYNPIEIKDQFEYNIDQKINIKSDVKKLFTVFNPLDLLNTEVEEKKENDKEVF